MQFGPGVCPSIHMSMVGPSWPGTHVMEVTAVDWAAAAATVAMGAVEAAVGAKAVWEDEAGWEEPAAPVVA
jgi:hypothetical protein